MLAPPLPISYVLNQPTGGTLSDCRSGTFSVCRRHQFEVQFNNTVTYLKGIIPEIGQKVERMKYWVFDTDPLLSLAPSDIYYFGMNPRVKTTGDYSKEGQGFDSYKAWSECLYDDQHPKPHCTYLDDKWLGGGSRKSCLQNRLIIILRSVLRGLNKPDDDASIRAIPKTNLFYYRTESEMQLKELLELTQSAPESARMDCWEYHEKIFYIVRPRIIVCNGYGSQVSPYQRVVKEYQPVGQECLGVKWLRGQQIKYTIIEKAPWSNSRILVIGLPHMSWSNPCDKRIIGGSFSVLNDVTDRIQALLGRG